MVPHILTLSQPHILKSRRAYKIRDVFEEMDLNGVAPQAMTFFRAMFACMKARRLGDTLYYWDRMQRSGIQPDVRVPAGVGWRLRLQAASLP